MRYFAYGSNMHIERLRERVTSFDYICTGILKEYNLKFHKKSRDGSGKCNANYTGNEKDQVHGVIFEIPQNEKGKLDRAEGLGAGYSEQNVHVMSKFGLTSAFTYIAESDAIDDSLRPYLWYKQFVINAAKYFHLPDEYIRMIEMVEYLQDSNQERVRKNLAILNRLRIT
jgi:gamma-glutamylcyclotransferase